MARLSAHHEPEYLNDHDEGKCSVPMWSGGCPAGFCDEPAFGLYIPGEEWRHPSGALIRLDGKYNGYVPALACRKHGGPEALASLREDCKRWEKQCDEQGREIDRLANAGAELGCQFEEQAIDAAAKEGE